MEMIVCENLLKLKIKIATLNIEPIGTTQQLVHHRLMTHWRHMETQTRLRHATNVVGWLLPTNDDVARVAFQHLRPSLLRQAQRARQEQRIRQAQRARQAQRIRHARQARLRQARSIRQTRLAQARRQQDRRFALEYSTLAIEVQQSDQPKCQCDLMPHCPV